MILRASAAILLVFSLACAGGGDSSTAGPVDQDVRGVYAVAWSDALTIRLDIGGAVQEATVGVDEVITFDAPDGSPLVLDLGAWCADPAVTCPSEAWPARIAIDQDDPTVVSDVHALRAWDADAPGAVVSGLVDHRDDAFLFGLDGASGGSGDCGALALSLAGGTFAHAAADTGAGTGGDTGVDVIAGGVPWIEGGTIGVVDGRVALGWLGVCAWSGLAVAATLSVETDYVAARVGDLE